MNFSGKRLSGNWPLKALIFARARQRLSNWREALALRLSSGWDELRIIRLRDGTQLACRGGRLDWGTFSNLVLLGGCGVGLDYLHKAGEEPCVLDLGANIGLFSVLAARANPRATVIAYEPAPPNLRICEINRLLNPRITDRIQLVAEAVGGTTRKAEFTYDEQQPEASALNHSRGVRYLVMVRSLAEIVTGLRRTVTLAKIDIEGAEFEVIEQTPKAVWEQVRAIAIELHSNDPARNQLLLNQLKSCGYQVAPERIGGHAYFLYR